MTEHKWADVLRAIADGKVAQFRDLDKYGWHVMSSVITPLTHPGLEWRIKPERKPDLVMFANVFSSNIQCGLSVATRNLSFLKETDHEDRVGIIRVTITHDDNGNPMRGPVEWCDE